MTKICFKKYVNIHWFLSYLLILDKKSAVVWRTCLDYIIFLVMNKTSVIQHKYNYIHLLLHTILKYFLLIIIALYFRNYYNIKKIINLIIM